MTVSERKTAVSSVADPSMRFGGVWEMSTVHTLGSQRSILTGNAPSLLAIQHYSVQAGVSQLLAQEALFHYSMSLVCRWPDMHGLWLKIMLQNCKTCASSNQNVCTSTAYQDHTAIAS